MKVSAKDCPKRRAGKKSGERRAGEGLRGRAGQTWAMGGLERKGRS